MVLITINTMHVMIIGDISPRAFLVEKMSFSFQIEVYIWLSPMVLLDHTNIFSYRSLTSGGES
jgi:hypothetical protein